MNIIINQKKENRFKDGINALLNLDKESFEEVIRKLNTETNYLDKLDFFYSDEIKADGTYVKDAYVRAEKFSVHKILKELENILSNIQSKNDLSNKINELLETRNIESFKKHIIHKYLENEDELILLNETIELLTNDFKVQDFLDFVGKSKSQENKEDRDTIKAKLELIRIIFGREDGKDSITGRGIDLEKFYIPETDIIKENYDKIKETINFERYLNPAYTFEFLNFQDGLPSDIVDEKDEIEWNVHPELKEEVFKEMPEELSLEEKAIYIYIKLCENLVYDEGFRINGSKYIKDDYALLQNRFAECKSGSKITCWEFARMYSKLIDELDGDIHSTVISRGKNRGHFVTGFYTDRVSFIVDGTGVNSFSTNDLTKVKLGLQPEGIVVVSDKDNIVTDSIEKASEYALDKQYSIGEYLSKLRGLPRDLVPEDLQSKLETFTEYMGEKEIIGNEALQAFIIFYKAGFFGHSLDRVFVVEEEKQENGEKTYKRMALIKERDEEKEIFLVNTEDLVIHPTDIEDVREKFDTGKYRYEDSLRRLKIIDERE